MEIPILQKKIEDLKLEVDALKSVQKSEVLMNHDLKCYNKCNFCYIIYYATKGKFSTRI